MGSRQKDKERGNSKGIATAVSKTSAPLTEGWSSGGGKWPGKDPNDRTELNFCNTDGGIVKTAGLQLLQGRDTDLLGASVRSIATLLSGDFIRLVVIAIVIASPIAWWSMSKWLAGHNYHINISWWTFFAAGLIAILIALITVSFQAIKAAAANPVKSLRTE